MFSIFAISTERFSRWVFVRHCSQWRLTQSASPRCTSTRSLNLILCGLFGTTTTSALTCTFHQDAKGHQADAPVTVDICKVPNWPCVGEQASIMLVAHLHSSVQLVDHTITVLLCSHFKQFDFAEYARSARLVSLQLRAYALGLSGAAVEQPSVFHVTIATDVRVTIWAQMIDMRMLLR